MPHLVVVPRANANDDEVLLLEWLTGDGEDVRAGSVICAVETTKAVVDIEAGADGVLRHIATEGERVAVGAALAAVTETADAPLPELTPAGTTAGPARPAPGTVDLAGEETTLTAAAPPQRRWTRKAEILASRAGIDLSALAETLGREVTEADVRQAQDGPATPASAPVPSANPTTRPAAAAGTRITGPTRVVVVGAALAAMQMIDVMSRLPHLRPVAVVDDDPTKLGGDVLGVPVVGTSADVARLIEENVADAAVISVASSMSARSGLFARLRDAGVPFVNVIDPSVVIGIGVTIGVGNYIGPHSWIGPASVVGDNCYLPSQVVIEHHNVWGDTIATGPGVTASGLVHVEDGVKMGTGIFLEPSVHIGAGSVISSGALLTADVPGDSAVKVQVKQFVRPLA